MRDVQSAQLNMREPTKPKMPKVIEHMRVHPKMGGGVTVAHHYTSMEHEPKSHNFGPEQGPAFHEHMAKFAGMPMAAEAENEETATPEEEQA